MNTQELKEKILSEMKHLGFLKTYSEIVISNFDKYEQSNKSEGLPKETKEFINLWKEIEGMKKEISEQYAYTKKYIACIDECRAEIETLKKQVEELNESVLYLMKDKNKPVSDVKKFIVTPCGQNGNIEYYEIHKSDGRYVCSTNSESMKNLIINSLEGK